MVVSIVLVTFISLTFVGTAILLQAQVNQMKNYWFDRAQVAVYLCTDFSTLGGCDQVAASPDQKTAIEQRLESSTLDPYIERFYFEDREQAFENFQDQFADSAVVDLVSPELLPETFWINLVDPEQSDLIFEAISGLPGVESVVDQRSYLDQIFALLNAGSLTAVAVAGLMLLAAALLIATTIRLSAFSRRRELAIMRLVGASNRFIQTPFVLEGLLLPPWGPLSHRSPFGESSECSFRAISAKRSRQQCSSKHRMRLPPCPSCLPQGLALRWWHRMSRLPGISGLRSVSPFSLAINCGVRPGSGR